MTINSCYVQEDAKSLGYIPIIVPHMRKKFSNREGQQVQVTHILDFTEIYRGTDVSIYRQ